VSSDRTFDRRSSPRAFTIVEMIVVLSILALLVGLLVPTLGGVRTASMRTSCLGNLRQMSIAAQQYSAVHGCYPVAIEYDLRDGAAVRVAWDWVTTFASDELVEPGPLWAFTDDPGEVMRCPGYAGPPSGEGDPFTGYNYNTGFVGGERMVVDLGWDPRVDRASLRAGRERRPDRVAVFGCGGWSGGTNKFMRSPADPAHSRDLRYAGGQAFHYGGATTVGYLDGHVGVMDRPHEGEDATDGLRSLLGHPDNGFLSDDGSAYDPQ